MKKLLAAGLCLTMCVWAAPLGVAAAARDLDIEHGLASQLKELASAFRGYMTIKPSS